MVFVRGFQVVIVSTVVGGLWVAVRAVLGEAVWRGLVVGSVECASNGMVVCTLHDGTVGGALDDGMVICALHDCTVMCTLDDGTVMCEVDDGKVMCALDGGTVICTLDDALFLFIIPLLEVDFVDMLGTA